MRPWMMASVVGFLGLLAAAAASGATFPCTPEGLDDAVRTGGGPHALECTPADTITVPAAAGGIAIAGELVLDLRGVTIEFESPARGRIAIGPSADCTAAGCVRGATSVELRDFTLRGELEIHTDAGFDPPGSVDATIREAWIAAPPDRRGGIHVGGPNTKLHLADSTLDGNRDGIRLGTGAQATIERSLIENTAGSALLLMPLVSPPSLLSPAEARVVNSTFSHNGAAPFQHTLQNGGLLDLESTTIVAASPGDVVYDDLAVVLLGGRQVSICGAGRVTSVNTLVQGSCTRCGQPLGPEQMTSLGGNLESDGDTCGFTDATDQVDVGSAALALGPLTDDGGPTATHPLLPGSAAIDAGVDCPPPTEDQRGVGRPQGDACDVGAYELEQTLEVGIEIWPRRPGGHPAGLHRRGRRGGGGISVAILGSEDLDVADVDTTTLAFGPEGAAPIDRRERHRRDVNRDGFPDLVSRYATGETGIAFGDTEACLTGALQDGTPFEGCAAFRAAPRRGAAWIRPARQRR